MSDTVKEILIWSSIFVALVFLFLLARRMLKQIDRDLAEINRLKDSVEDIMQESEKKTSQE